MESKINEHAMESNATKIHKLIWVPCVLKVLQNSAFINVIFLVAKLFKLSITLAVHPSSPPIIPTKSNLIEGICLFV
jgi:nitrous oxidase accessory protein NosD